MYELWAKSPALRPPGELLSRHLQATVIALLRIQARIGRITVVPDRFWILAAIGALLHDTGKLPDGFQRMVGNSAGPPVVWGQRHEVLSLGFIGLLLRGIPDNDRAWIAAVVAGHHRPFTGGPDAPRRPLFIEYGRDSVNDFRAKFLPSHQGCFVRLCTWLHAAAHRFELPLNELPTATLVEDLTDEAHRQFTQLMDRWEIPLDFDQEGDGLTAVLLLGALTMADHLSSGHRGLQINQPLTPSYRSQVIDRLAVTGHTLRPQQLRSADAKGHILLRSWTGSGKTEGSLMWARTQVTDLIAVTGGNPRIFYLLPYLASINAMAGRLIDELGNSDGIGIVHSKAASFHLARSLAECCTDDDTLPNTAADFAAKAHSRAVATRNFHELLRVGTPYQLLRGALAGPIHAPILVDSANSVFILDELHAFDARRLGMILAMMRLWERIGGRIAVLSATMPTVLVKLITETLHQPVELIEAPAKATAPARHRIITRTTHLTADATIAEIRDELAAGQSVLIVANNVKDAIHLYQQLGPTCVELHGADSTFLLHSRFKRHHRTAIENAVLQRFQVGAPGRPGLLIGTQVVEVSLNIDLDRCHTSAADLEALLQRFGRVNRAGARPAAPVIVHEPNYATRGRGRELWADGVYEEAPTRLAWDILRRHDGQIVDERATTTWLDEVYASDWGRRWHATVETQSKEFESAFLTFAQPFDDRSALSDRFDELFDGTEAILAEDCDAYADALAATGNYASAGKLLADRYLIPMPHWAVSLTRYEKELGVRVIDGDYDPELGLLAVRGPAQNTYRAGWVL